MKSKLNRFTGYKFLFFSTLFILLCCVFLGIEPTMLIIGIAASLLAVCHLVIKLSSIAKPYSKINNKFSSKYEPFVCIHVACKSEPAELVNQTIKAMTKLDYDNYEVIVINSNSTDKENYEKIRKYIKKCGNKFKFVHLDKVSGFKAGALNFLINQHLDKKVDIIAVVDCDYIVSPDFLKKTVGYFKDPDVGIVQLPQSYYNRDKYNTGMFLEYRSFFTLVMHQSQRLGLVTFTGTMGLIKAELIHNGLKWNEWCITEDVEAGVHINSIGYKGIYLDENLGKGLMPYEYASLVKQRQRWTYGNMQVIKKDIVSIFSNKALTIKQKISFLALMVTWFHFEFIFAVIYLINKIVISLGYNGQIASTVSTLMIVMLAISLASNLVYFIVGMRQEANIKDRLKAFLSHYGLLYVMSTSWLTCIFGKKLGFIVTKKEKIDGKVPFCHYSRELIIPLLLSISAVLSILSKNYTLGEIIISIIFIFIELAGVGYLKKAFENNA